MERQSRYLHIPAFWPVPDCKGHWVSDGEGLYYSAALDKTLITPAGAVNDLASIPRFFRRVFDVNGPHRVAAANHDYRYSTGGKVRAYCGEDGPEELQLTREQVDALFLEEMLIPRDVLWNGLSHRARFYVEQAGMAHHFLSDKPVVNRITATLMHAGVRLGGKGHFGSTGA